MKLEDQVLSIKQVQELRELGFDIEKHSSMCWVAYTSDEEPYEKEYSLSILDEFCYESASLEPIPTMSIGDTINVLPETIITEYYGENIRSHIEINKKVVCYPCYDKNGEVSIMLFHSMQENLIDSLFDCLVWCIKEKHIAL